LSHPDAETNEYYASALNPFFTQIRKGAYITIGRWSYAESADNPLLFNPGPVGGLDPRDAEFINEKVNNAHYQRVLKEFSFTKLLSDHDREIWFHFTNEDPPDIDESQVYLRVANAQKKTRIIEVAAREVTPILVDQIISAFESVYGATIDNGVPLRKKVRAISNTLESAIFSILNSPDCDINHVTFMPVTISSNGRSVVGLVSINSRDHIRVGELESLFQPFVEGLMSHFLFKEIDERRHVFALRSAIAAIMSRNMSHNLGSHVLWHLAQQLAQEELY
jgi:hypothetical protein